MKRDTGGAAARFDAFELAETGGFITGVVDPAELPRLADLNGNWSRLNAAAARAAYDESLAAVDLFLENHSGLGLRNLVRSPERLPEITADLDRRLRDN